MEDDRDCSLSLSTLLLLDSMYCLVWCVLYDCAVRWSEVFVRLLCVRMFVCLSVCAGMRARPCALMYFHARYEWTVAKER